MDDWEVFRGDGKQKKTKRLYVTYRPDGVILFSNRAFTALGTPESVLMSYNRAKRLAALKPMRSDADARAVIVRIYGLVPAIAGRAFAKEYDIDLSKTQRYPASMREGELVIDLNAGVDVSRKRNGRRSTRL